MSEATAWKLFLSSLLWQAEEHQAEARRMAVLNAKKTPASSWPAVSSTADAEDAHDDPVLQRRSRREDEALAVGVCSRQLTPSYAGPDPVAVAQWKEEHDRHRGGAPMLVPLSDVAWEAPSVVSLLAGLGTAPAPWMAGAPAASGGDNGDTLRTFVQRVWREVGAGVELDLATQADAVSHLMRVSHRIVARTLTLRMHSGGADAVLRGGPRSYATEHGRTRLGASSEAGDRTTVLRACESLQLFTQDEMTKLEEVVNTILAPPEEERPPARKRTKKASKHASRGERTRKQRVRKRKKDTRARDKKRGGKKRSRKKKKRAKKNPT